MMTTTLAAGEASGIAVDLLKVLACAGVVAMVFARLKLAAIPGYLIAGAIVGPHAIGLVSNPESISSIASLAVVLLMFGIGLHLDLGGQKAKGTIPILLIGVVSTIFSTILLTLTAKIFGLPWASSIAVGMALSLSSTAVVMRLLQRRRELQRTHGRLSFGILLMQDLIVIVMLAVMPVLFEMGGVAPEAEPSDGGEGGIGVVGIALRIAGVAGLLAFGRFVLPRLMFEAAKDASGEVLLVIAGAVALGAAVASGALGLSPELGAFVAGFMLASTPVRYQLSGQLSPLRDLFMAVFFTAVGLELNIGLIAPLWWVVVIGGAVLTAIKAFSIGITSWAFGASSGISVRTAGALFQGGEFSIVVLAAAGLLLDQTQSAVIIAIIVISLILTPSSISLSPMIAARFSMLRLAPWIKNATLVEHPVRELDSTQDEESIDADWPARSCPVIIAGFGPVGRACAEQFAKQGVPFTIVELNPKTVRTQGAIGKSVVYGDVTNPEVLESAGIHAAKAVILTIPDEDATIRACKLVRSLSPDVFISARAMTLGKGLTAKQQGADHVVVDEVATARAMSDEVMELLLERHAGHTETERKEPKA